MKIVATRYHMLKIDLKCSTWASKSSTPRSRYFSVVGQSFAKTVAGRHGHAAYHNKH